MKMIYVYYVHNTFDDTYILFLVLDILRLLVLNEKLSEEFFAASHADTFVNNSIDIAR